MSHCGCNDLLSILSSVYSAFFAVRTNQRTAVVLKFYLSVQLLSLKSVGRTCLCQVRHLNKMKSDKNVQNCPKFDPGLNESYSQMISGRH